MRRQDPNSAALFDYLRNTLNIAEGSVFADIGAETGIFTEQLLRCGYRVLAVEPNGDMRRKAEERFSKSGGFISVNGSDRDFNLPDRSADCVTAAQSFHWFDAEAFRGECRRVLKPGGTAIIVYNFRDERAACAKALAKLRHKYNSEFPGFSNGMSSERCVDFFRGRCRVFRADNTQIYDRQSYVARVLSSSYSLKENDGRYSEYICEIKEIFDTLSKDGMITLPIETVAYIGKT